MYTDYNVFWMNLDYVLWMTVDFEFWIN